MIIMIIIVSGGRVSRALGMGDQGGFDRLEQGLILQGWISP